MDLWVSRYSHHLVDHIVEPPVWSRWYPWAVDDMPIPPRRAISYDCAESLAVEELVDTADTKSDFVSGCSSVPVRVDKLSDSIALLRLLAGAAGSRCCRVIIRVCTEHRLSLTEEVNRATVDTVSAERYRQHPAVQHVFSISALHFGVVEIEQVFAMRPLHIGLTEMNSGDGATVKSRKYGIHQAIVGQVVPGAWYVAVKDLTQDT